MQLSYINSRVIDNKEISKGVFKLTAQGNFSGSPGQFYMIRGWKDEPLLSRPLSIHDIDNNSISFLYQLKGRGTDIISKLHTGDAITLLGPLGNGFDVENIKGKIAVVAGGIGIAPMLHVLKNMKDADIDVYAGFRNDVYMIDEIKRYASNVYVSTENGSCGYKGYITEIFNPIEYNAVLCCGPDIMMRKIAEVCRKCATPVYVSMESRMACGVGACLGCTCETEKGNKRVCKDGPVFPGRDVVLGA